MEAEKAEASASAGWRPRRAYRMLSRPAVASSYGDSEKCDRRELREIMALIGIMASCIVAKRPAYRLEAAPRRLNVSSVAMWLQRKAAYPAAPSAAALASQHQK